MMTTCEKLKICPFFQDQMGELAAVAEMMKKCFCLNDRSKCARYQVSNAGIPVPPDLFPYQADRAEQLIRERA
jgi:hypothetical protein